MEDILSVSLFAVPLLSSKYEVFPQDVRKKTERESDTIKSLKNIPVFKTGFLSKVRKESLLVLTGIF